jgi:hypothetical protein
LRLAIRERHLFFDAERTRLQTWLIVGAFLVFIGLIVSSFFVHRVQLIEVAWLGISTYGLTFDFLNLQTSKRDLENMTALGKTDAFNRVYFEEKTRAAKKRVIALSIMFFIGVFACLAAPAPPNPDAKVGSIVTQTFFFVMGYCIASNAQDSWLSRRRQEVISGG